MKRLATAILAVAVVVTIATHTEARNRPHHRGHFWPGFGVGVFTGALIAPHFYQPRYYYAPPVYLTPQPRCY